MTQARALALRIPLAALAAVSCAARPLPDPRDAARAYADAAVRGDGAALYAMMSLDSRKTHSETEVKAVVASEKPELAEQGQALLAPDSRVAATARVRYPDGEEAALELAHGRYWVTAAGALPGGGRTPEEALEQLRRVLARRSYDGLLRVLSAETRAAVEHDVRAIVEGLGEPEELPVKIDGDAATVGVPGGHQVKLRRQEGVWRVEDFD